MTTHPPNIRTEGKQFRLVKFFALASFIVMIIFSFPFSMFISQRAKEILLRSYENYALLVGENLNHQVLINFVGVVLYERNENISLRQMEQRIVNIHQLGEDVIAYSTDPELIGTKVKESLGYKKAAKGEASSGLISRRDDFLGLGIEFLGETKKLRTYVPFRGPIPSASARAGDVGGVFELIQDLSEEYEDIVRFQFLIFGLSTLIMILIFVALLLIVHKAEGIIEQRAKERLKLEEQLNQAERLAALGEMVAGVSHEVKNPLVIIQSTAELLGGMPDANENQKRLSGVIKEESGRLNSIVTKFLDFARPQVPFLQECHLEKILEKNLTFLQPELDKRNIQVNDHVNGKPLLLRADQELLYRALLNIFLNAIQATPDGGSITIKVEEEKDYYQIEIQDTGRGINRENVKKIFNPFFTTKEKGSGLGLSIVRKIIEGHRGTIAIESKEGKGTTVKISLPLRGSVG
jgi:signal transduction histidine kinase